MCPHFYMGSKYSAGLCECICMYTAKYPNIYTLNAYKLRILAYSMFFFITGSSKGLQNETLFIDPQGIDRYQ